MDLETRFELRRRVAIEAIERRDKTGAYEAINDYIQAGITLMELDRIANETHDYIGKEEEYNELY